MADDALLTLSADLGLALKARGWSLVLAESCTGGWAGQVITAIPGSSAWFDRGFVTYSNAAKEEMLQVPAKTLAQYGAVCEQTATAMAIGALKNSHGTISGAITGIAGPDGGTADKPVGTVCFAWATQDGALLTATHRFAGDRQAIRQQSVRTLLQGLMELATCA